METTQANRRRELADLKRQRRTDRIKQHKPTLNRAIQREIEEQDRHLREIERDEPSGLLQRERPSDGSVAA
jgi:hypothetical protein